MDQETQRKQENRKGGKPWFGEIFRDISDRYALLKSIFFPVPVFILSSYLLLTVGGGLCFRPANSGFSNHTTIRNAMTQPSW